MHELKPGGADIMVTEENKVCDEILRWWYLVSSLSPVGGGLKLLYRLL